MENPSAFELNAAIQRWRKVQALSPALQGEDLDELESHLRDGVEDLHVCGLSEEEAFLIATRRIGRAEVLAQEFGRVNTVALWRDRALWMLAGVLLLSIGGACGSMVFQALLCLGCTFNSDGFILGWAGGIARMLTFIATAWVFWRLANGHYRGLGEFSSRFTRRPVPYVVVAIVGTLLVMVAPYWMTMLSVQNLKPTAVAQTYLIANWFSIIVSCLQQVLVILAFAKLWRWRTRSLAAGQAAA